MGTAETAVSAAQTLLSVAEMVVSVAEPSVSAAETIFSAAQTAVWADTDAKTMVFGVIRSSALTDVFESPSGAVFQKCFLRNVFGKTFQLI